MRVEATTPVTLSHPDQPHAQVRANADSRSGRPDLPLHLGAREDQGRDCSPAFRREPPGHRRHVGHALRLAVARDARHRRRDRIRARLRADRGDLHPRPLVPEGGRMIIRLVLLSCAIAETAMAYVTLTVATASVWEAS